MAEGHEHELDMLTLVPEEHARWWRLSFLADEVEVQQRRLERAVIDARDAGWSWRRLGAATGIPAETLRLRHSRLDRDSGGGRPAAGVSPAGLSGDQPTLPGTT